MTTLTQLEQSVLDAVMPIIQEVEQTVIKSIDAEVAAARCPFCDHLVSKHSKRGCTHRVAMKYAEPSLWWKTSGRCLCAVGVEDPPEQVEVTTLSDPEPRYVDVPANVHPLENCGPLVLTLPAGSKCPTCGHRAGEPTRSTKFQRAAGHDPADEPDWRGRTGG